jgi:hypothetical protein
MPTSRATGQASRPQGERRERGEVEGFSGHRRED